MPKSERSSAPKSSGRGPVAFSIGRCSITAMARAVLQGFLELSNAARAANTDDHGRHLLIAIARCSVISKSEHVRILPPPWGRLYQLTRLPVVPKSLDQAVEFR